jgi:hypothetical protein
MAFSATLLDTNISGKYVEKYFDADFASVTLGHIPTGLSTIVFAQFLNHTTENDGKLAINKNSANDAVEAGGLYCSGFTSNDTARIKVVGY